MGREDKTVLTRYTVTLVYADMNDHTRAFHDLFAADLFVRRSKEKPGVMRIIVYEVKTDENGILSRSIVNRKVLSVWQRTRGGWTCRFQ